jgi:hypothetical protein
VAVSVDLMSTGIDIPDLEFIVFLRQVKSRILFEQMLGRGTRKGEQFPDKSHFTVFDCFDGTLLKYFRDATAITAEPPDKPSRTITEIVEAIWNNQDRDYNVRCLCGGYSGSTRRCPARLARCSPPRASRTAISDGSPANSPIACIVSSRRS